MKRGLVLGKFHPLHIGHIELIKFAMAQCDELIVLVCASDLEIIPGEMRLNWVEQSFVNNQIVKPILLDYKEDELPNTSVSSREVSRIWAHKIKDFLPEFNVIISSEPYGDYLAEYLMCQHIMYDQKRIGQNISASKIMQDSTKHWKFIADSAKPYFVKKICIYGTESTGKSTLTKRLSEYYKTVFVPEMARQVIEHTEECTKQHLVQIAELQAKRIIAETKSANRFLFIDTDLAITSSYSKFLFNQELRVDEWVKSANKIDLYLYLDKEAPFIQDGTRLDKRRRDILDEYHRNELTKKDYHYSLIRGSWDERFENSKKRINDYFGIDR